MMAFSYPNVSEAINPLYRLEARNFVIGGVTNSAVENVLEFDLYIQHTNLEESGPFLFLSGEYMLNFNSLIANGGTLTLEMIPGSSDFNDPKARPVNPEIMGDILMLHKGDSLPINPPEISVDAPGSRIIRVRLSTSAPAFAPVFLDVAWRDSTYGDPYTHVAALVDNENTDVTQNGTLIVDPYNPPLPVELASFTSSVLRNQVTLNWMTISEINNSGFDVERFNVNEPSSGWIKTGYVSGNGTTNDQHSYSFSELVNTGKFKYRIKQTDFNGNYEYHNLAGEVNVGVPASYSLSQNFPNPFNPSTTISYDIASDGKVNITVFDITGREVATLVNEVQTAGYYTVELNASGLNSGLYFYRITAGNVNGGFVETKKMVLIK